MDMHEHQDRISRETLETMEALKPLAETNDVARGTITRLRRSLLLPIDPLETRTLAQAEQSIEEWWAWLATAPPDEDARP